jgi:hypothetical protein
MKRFRGLVRQNAPWSDFVCVFVRRQSRSRACSICSMCPGRFSLPSRQTTPPLIPIYLATKTQVEDTRSIDLHENFPVASTNRHLGKTYVVLNHTNSGGASKLFLGGPA